MLENREQPAPSWVQLAYKFSGWDFAELSKRLAGLL